MRIGVEVEQTNSAKAEIRVWMLRNGVRPRDIAAELDLNPSTVTNFLNGRTVSSRIAEHLRRKGCPDQLLDALKAA